MKDGISDFGWKLISMVEAYVQTAIPTNIMIQFGPDYFEI